MFNRLSLNCQLYDYKRSVSFSLLLAFYLLLASPFVIFLRVFSATLVVSHPYTSSFGLALKSLSLYLFSFFPISVAATRGPCPRCAPSTYHITSFLAKITPICLFIIVPSLLTISVVFLNIQSVELTSASSAAVQHFIFEFSPRRRPLCLFFRFYRGDNHLRLTKTSSPLNYPTNSLSLYVTQNTSVTDIYRRSSFTPLHIRPQLLIPYLYAILLCSTIGHVSHR